jgi:hypothetical protein
MATSGLHLNSDPQHRPLIVVRPLFSSVPTIPKPPRLPAFPAPVIEAKAHGSPLGTLLALATGVAIGIGSAFLAGLI